MRKVIFKRYIQGAWEQKDGFRIKKEGTGCWGAMNNNGFFHQWGYESEEAGESVATNSVAIIENPDGTVETVSPSSMKFVE